jgi:hypothetical protein
MDEASMETVQEPGSILVPKGQKIWFRHELGMGEKQLSHVP